MAAMNDDILVTQPNGHHLAELNIGMAVDDLDTPTMAGFMNALDKVNRIADRSPGFVWRLQDEAGNATGVKHSDNPREIVNLSVWQTSADLEHYVWNTVHRQFMKRRAQWFVPLDRPYFVMWWVPIGIVPTLAEALDRLARLRRDGPSPDAFGWGDLPGQRIWDQA
jgi:hypothetical protein